MGMKDNGMPVRFDLLAGWFFGLSAIFHAFPVITGPFDRFAWAYWKQIDAAWSYWRWCAQPRLARVPARNRTRRPWLNSKL